MRYQLAIIAVWLALPLAALLLLRGDFERYRSAVAAQGERAEALGEHLDYYASLYGMRLAEVAMLQTTDDRRRWEREWDELETTEEEDRAALDGPLAHYPDTGEVLEEAAERLSELKRHSWDGSRLQDRWIKESLALEQTLRYLDGMEMEVQYQARFGTMNSYLAAQALLAQLEADYRMRDQQRRATSRQLDETLRAAQNAEAALRDLRREVDAALDRDSGRTYREDLLARFARFDLRATLRELVLGSSAQAEGQ